MRKMEELTINNDFKIISISKRKFPKILAFPLFSFWPVGLLWFEVTYEFEGVQHTLLFHDIAMREATLYWYIDMRINIDLATNKAKHDGAKMLQKYSLLNSNENTSDGVDQ